MQPKPAQSDDLAYGGYLVNAGGCIECHTQVEKGQIIRDVAYGGGREFKFPNGAIVRSANISPDTETGIGKWSKEQFVARFKAFGDSLYVAPSVKPEDFNTIMPWVMYAGMTESDLSAIYTYLKSVKSVPNKVEIFTAP